MCLYKKLEMMRSELHHVAVRLSTNRKARVASPGGKTHRLEVFSGQCTWMDGRIYSARR